MRILFTNIFQDCESEILICTPVRALDELYDSNGISKLSKEADSPRRTCVATLYISRFFDDEILRELLFEVNSLEESYFNEVDSRNCLM